MHGNDRGLGFQHEAGGEHLPRQVLRLAEPLGRGGNAAGREDDDGDAFLEQFQRLLPNGEIVLQRLLGFPEIDGQRIGLHLVDLQKVGMDHDPERPPELFGH